MTEELLEFKVSSKTNVHKISSKIYKTWLEKTPFEIVAIGAGAVNQAIKGVTEARGKLSKSGYDIAMIPSFRDLDIDEVHKSAIAMKLVELK